MELTVNQRRKLKQGLTIIIVGTLLGPFYAMFSDGFGAAYPFVNGAIAAFILAMAVAVLELYAFTGSIRRMKFITLFLLRSLVYLVIIFLVSFHVFLVSRIVRFDLSYGEVLRSEEFRNYIFKGDYYLVLVYALVLVAGINFTRQMSRKLGQGVLLSYISGRFRTPREEERILMFIELVDNKEIAVKLGAKQFHRFLNDFIFDITDSLVMHRGIIYQYVEDQVVVTWTLKKGLDRANCIRAFFHAQDELELRREKYFNRYRLVPSMRAALHCGKVIKAEIGEVKSEVALFGDAVNTTARILGKCHDLGRNVLVSAHLHYRLELPSIYSATARGHVELKGKEDQLELFSIEESHLDKSNV